MTVFININEELYGLSLEGIYGKRVSLVIIFQKFKTTLKSNTFSGGSFKFTSSKIYIQVGWLLA